MTSVVHLERSGIRGSHYSDLIGAQHVEVTFWGVRGSSPCHGPDVARYGGNTSCVHVAVPGHGPILLDIGTGARYFGANWPDEQPFHGTCLLTHLHWDHVLGLPFFPPVLRPGNTLDVHAPRQADGRAVSDAFDSMLCPPFFPVGLDVFPGEVRFHEHDADEFEIGEVRVVARHVPHIGPTLGYRLEWNGTAITYISDHQQPDHFDVPDAVAELCDGADLLIHDAQFTPDEFDRKRDWGHCTVEFACRLARECGVSALALFHHDPTHDDDQLDAMVAEATADCDDLRVIAARERCTFVVGR